MLSLSAVALTKGLLQQALLWLLTWCSPQPVMSVMFLRLTQGTYLNYRSGLLLAPLQISDLVAVFNDKLHMFNSSAILFGSFRTLRWIGSSLSDLLQFNLSSCFSTFSYAPLTAVHLHKPKIGISLFSSEWRPIQKLFGNLCEFFLLLDLFFSYSAD